MKKLLIANWKLNKTQDEVKSFFSAFAQNYSPKEVGVIICCPYPYLALSSYLVKQLGLSNVFIGSQDVSVFKEGAHTGEVSAKQVRDFADYAIVGHSERGEDLKVVLEKIANCKEVGLIPIVCVRDVATFDSFDKEGTVLVWEDPSSISKNGVSNIKSIQEIKEGVEKLLPKVGDRGVLYGGSVSESTAPLLAEIEGVSGFLVGHASLNPASFLSLLASL